jgi:hypothetical protein
MDNAIYTGKCLLGADSYSSIHRIIPPEPLTEEIYRKAIRNNSDALAAIPMEQGTYELCVEALQNEESIGSPPLEYVPPRLLTREIILAAVCQNSDAF